MLQHAGGFDTVLRIVLHHQLYECAPICGLLAPGSAVDTLLESPCHCDEAKCQESGADMEMGDGGDDFE